jgi:hypothetical protein
MHRLSHSWELAKRSWGVLRSDKTLAAIPALAGLAVLAALGLFAALFFLLGFDFGSDDSSAAVEPAGYVIAVAAYVVFAFITVYFQGALIAGADDALHGREVTIGGAFAAASGKLHRLLPWAVVTATVTLIISALERQGWIGDLVASLIGMAWNVLTFLTVPIIMLEDVGPVTALKRSGTLFKRTWGENLLAQVGFGLIGMIAVLPAVAVGAIGIATGNVVAIGLAIGVAAIWIVIVNVVIAALSGIYRTALYRYAAEHEVPAAFAGEDFEAAFRPRRGRGRFS